MELHASPSSRRMGCHTEPAPIREDRWPCQPVYVVRLAAHFELDLVVFVRIAVAAAAAAAAATDTAAGLMGSVLAAVLAGGACTGADSRATGSQTENIVKEELRCSRTKVGIAGVVCSTVLGQESPLGRVECIQLIVTWRFNLRCGTSVGGKSTGQSVGWVAVLLYTVQQGVSTTRRMPIWRVKRGVAWHSRARLK